MTNNELDAIFANALHAKQPAAKKPAPIDPLVKLQKALDALTGPDNRCDLRKAAGLSSQGERVVVLKETEKRDYAFHSATGDESLATLSSRAIGNGNNVSKATEEDRIDLYGGFVSRGQITGES